MKRQIFQVKRMLWAGIWSMMVATVFLQAEEQPVGELVIEGTGDSQFLLRTIARRFEDRYPGTTIHIPDSIGSSGGIKAVSAGKVELARIARTLKKAEALQDLIYVAFAMSPVVFVVHPSVQGVKSLSEDEIVGIYSGTITQWQQVGGPAHKLYPIGREVGDSSRNILEAHLPKFQAVREPVAKVFYTTPETLQAIAEHEYTIGYVPRAIIENVELRVVAVDGVAPSIENMRQNRYAMVTPLGIVYKKPLSPLAKTFVEFLFSPEAHEVFEAYGCLPMEKLAIE